MFFFGLSFINFCSDLLQQILKMDCFCFSRILTGEILGYFGGALFYKVSTYSFKAPSRAALLVYHACGCVVLQLSSESKILSHSVDHWLLNSVSNLHMSSRFLWFLLLCISSLIPRWPNHIKGIVLILFFYVSMIYSLVKGLFWRHIPVLLKGMCILLLNETFCSFLLSPYV